MFVVKGRKKCLIAVLAIAILLFLYWHFYVESDNYSIVEKIGNKEYNIKILPKDHLDAVRLEVDGDVNMDYWREILFGVDHQLVSPGNKDVALRLIRKIFHLNDENHDKQLDNNEIFTLITNNIKGHVNRAMEAHKEAFKMLDSQKKGLIRWEDFVEKYLQLLGKNKPSIKQYLISPTKGDLLQNEKDVIANAQRRWKDADLNDDTFLSDTEYLGFVHPELNQVYLDRMCDKILMHLDRNNDGQLTEQEFIDSQHKHSVEVVTPYKGYVGPKDDEEISSDNESSRRREFREQIDTNQDGIATRKELIEYINPRNIANTRRDVNDIIKMIDSDKNGRLSLMELMANYQKVINSKMVNVAAAFHEEDL